MTSRSDGGSSSPGSRPSQVRVQMEAGPVDEAREEPLRARPRRNDPFSILVMGDFRGIDLGARADALPPLAERLPVLVDRDEVDRFMASLEPSVRIPVEGGGPPLMVTFRSREDFHPDRLLVRVPFFQAIREARQRLLDDPTSVSVQESDPEEQAPPSSPAHEMEGGDGLLDQVLAETPDPRRTNGSGEVSGEGSSAGPLGGAGELDALIRRLTREHGVSEPGEEVERRLKVLDAETTRQLRRLLHHPGFQTMEARWKGLEFLVRQLETSPKLKVYVLQVHREELLDAASGDLLPRLLDDAARNVLGEGTWSVVMLHQAFSSEPDDVAAMEGMARTGLTSGIPFLAEVDPSLLEGGDGDEDTQRRAWQRVRAHDGAPFLGLLLPRFLLRAPYDPEENPCETMEFQELETGEDPELTQLLWGHPGFAAVLLLGTAFAREGWEFRPGNVQELRGLPVAVHRSDSGPQVVPPTEVVLRGGEARELARAGFMSLTARPGEGSLRLGTFQSVALSGAPLAGPWS